MICSMLFIKPALSVEVCGKPQQGGFVKVYDADLQKIVLNGKTYEANEEGKLAIAFGRDDNLIQNFEVFYKNKKKEIKTLNLLETKWDVQEIKGVQPSKVTPKKADETEIMKERKAVSQGLKNMTKNSYWDEKMLKPVDGRTSGLFGGQRIMNGIRKNPHQGWDIAAPEGTEIKASAKGVVTLGDGPFFYSGNMVILDHGYGLSTIYAHLQKIFVKKGDVVEKGDIIGLVGKTGRVTGPHLHLGASLNDVRFDPQNLFNFNEKECFHL